MKEVNEEVNNEGCMVNIPMCVYNHEKYIAQSIEGVLNQQTNFKYRLIIGEDSSTDGSKKIIQYYLNKFPEKMKVIFHPKNVGANENSRILFKECKGKYIALCDGDDYWTDPYKLQKQVDFLEANKDYAICFHRANMDRNGQLSLHKLPSLMGKFYSYLDLLDSYNFIMTASVVFRNNFRLPGMFKQLPYGDMGLYCFATRVNNKIGCLPEVMSVYRIHAEGAWSGKKPLEINLTHYKFYKIIYSWLNPDEKKAVRRKISEVSENIALLKYPRTTLSRKLYQYYLKSKIILFK